MIESWIPITFAAAFLQNLRSALQKHLKGQLSTAGATFSRFLFAAPLAVIYVFVVAALEDSAVPAPSGFFLGVAAIGGVAQIMATALLVYIFSFRNFAVGTAFSKTETVQTALFGIVLLGDPLSLAAAIGILVSLVGVLALAIGPGKLTPALLATAWRDKAALLGIASGACFGIAAISYRAASLSLEQESAALAAGTTLAWVTAMQTLAMLIYLRWREPGQITAVVTSWRVSGLVGASGMAASACWFTAMTLQNAAYVRALGQVELVFTVLSSKFMFREKTTAREAFGVAAIVAGIVILLLG